MGAAAREGAAMMSTLKLVTAGFAIAFGFVPAHAAAQAHLLIVSGLGGEARYVDDFHTWGTTLVDAARGRLGLPAENIVFLSENPSRDPSRVNGESRREDVERAITDMAARADAEDRIMIVLFGHGSADARGARVNLPGPDITAEEFATIIAAFGDRPLAFVNTASASGDFADVLAGPNRTIITATRSGMERNETVFGRYFVEAFAQDGADADRNGRLTLAEAFDYALRETQRSYEMANRLQLENARIEGDSAFARVFHVQGTASAPSGASAETRELFTRRRELEEAIDALRLRAGQMEAAEYSAELERLLLELARTNQRIQEEEGPE
jgi:hypothetical protein